MQAELFPLPNLNSKILRSNFKDVPEEVLLPFFMGKNNKFVSVTEFLDTELNSEEFDILIILLHLYETKRKEDGLLYFNTDDILIFRGIKKNKALKAGFSGYKKEIRKRVDKKIKNLLSLKIFTVIDYKDFNYVLCLNSEYLGKIRFQKGLSRKVLSLNPLTKSWHKNIGIFLSILKINSNSNSINIQVKKLLSRVKITSLLPFQIRNRFEDTLDELTEIGIIKGWQYKNIDEEALHSKNWIFFWQLLSVKILY